MSAHQFPPTVYSLFLCGYDTVEIAKLRALPEDEVVRRLNAQRASAKGLPIETRPSPYKASPVKKWLAGDHPGIGRSGL